MVGAMDKKTKIIVAVVVGVVVLGLGGLFVVGFVTGFTGYLARARLQDANVTTARTQMQMLKSAVAIHTVQHGAPPASLSAMVSAGTLQPSSLNDPWKQPFNFKPSGQGGTLTSNGPDGTPGTADDLTLSF